MIDERLIQIKCIRYLERYFIEEYTEQNDIPEEKQARLNSFLYALEAYEDIVKSLSNRIDEKNFEYLTGAETYEIFKERLEDYWIDICVDNFEAR